jgi:molybdate transport system ATP-binding protein
MALEVMARAVAPIPLDVEFQVAPGELLTLVGHSGSGKTTVLRTIAGFWRPENARVTVGGKVWLDTSAGVDLPAHRRRIGIVFQSYALFPHMTAAENVNAALDHLARGDRAKEAERLLRLVHLDGVANRKPAQLSGGQQQRVAVARALARRPEALLLDEPFSAVDRATRETLYREIAELRHALDMPVVLVTHDMDEARLLADRIVVIEKGRIVAQGTTAEVMFDPTALRAMGLREVTSSLRARVEAQEEDGLTRLSTAAGPLLLPRIEALPGTQVRVRIMAHEVILAREAPRGLSALNILPVEVVALKPGEGPGVLVQLRLGEDSLLARITRRSAEILKLAPGDRVYAILKSMAVARDHVKGGGV